MASNRAKSEPKNYTLKSKKMVTPFKVLENHTITIEGDRIQKIEKFDKTVKLNYSLDELVIYPGLINAHDHLLGSYFPRIRDPLRNREDKPPNLTSHDELKKWLNTDRVPYVNWKEWDNELKASPIYAERGKNENIDLYYLGVFRHLICGVLTVSDHIPHFINDPFIPLMPIRVLKDYALAHEVSNYDLKWGDGVQIEHAKAVKNNVPFITHIEEGFDEEAMKGIDYLIDMEALTEHTVLIHGIALSDDDIKLIAANKAHLVWCPFSNFYMFNLTARVKEMIASGINISIGTDSPMSGSIHLLEEIKFAKAIYYEMYNETIADQAIVRMITINPAKALRIDHNLGSLEEGKIADFMAIKDDQERNPYSLLVEAELEDIALVFYKGKPIYGDVEFADLFKQFNLSYSHFRLNKCQKIMAGNNPLELVEKIQKAVGYKKGFPFLPIN